MQPSTREIPSYTFPIQPKRTILKPSSSQEGGIDVNLTPTTVPCVFAHTVHQRTSPESEREFTGPFSPCLQDTSDVVASTFSINSVKLIDVSNKTTRLTSYTSASDSDCVNVNVQQQCSVLRAPNIFMPQFDSTTQPCSVSSPHCCSHKSVSDDQSSSDPKLVLSSPVFGSSISKRSVTVLSNARGSVEAGRESTSLQTDTHTVPTQTPIELSIPSKYTYEKSILYPQNPPLHGQSPVENPYEIPFPFPPYPLQQRAMNIIRAALEAGDINRVSLSHAWKTLMNRKKGLESYNINRNSSNEANIETSEQNSFSPKDKEKNCEPRNNKCIPVVIEAPTGTGKTHILLNGVLSWLSYQRYTEAISMREKIGKRKKLIRERGGFKKSHNSKKAIKKSIKGISVRESGECDDDYIIDETAERKKKDNGVGTSKGRHTWSSSSSGSSVSDIDSLDITDDEDDDGIIREEDYKRLGVKETPNDIPPIGPKVWFASRTHTQLQQCAQEMTKTVFGQATILHNAAFCPYYIPPETLLRYPLPSDETIQAFLTSAKETKSQQHWERTQKSDNAEMKSDVTGNQLPQIQNGLNWYQEHQENAHTVDHHAAIVPNAPVSASTPVMPLSFVHIGSRNQLCINKNIIAISKGNSQFLNDTCKSEIKKYRANKTQKDLNNNGEGQIPVDRHTFRKRNSLVDLEDICPTTNEKNGRQIEDECGGCQFSDFSRLRLLREHMRTRCRDISEVKALGEQLEACPYLASKQMARTADVVFVHFNLLIEKNMRRGLLSNEPISVVAASIAEIESSDSDSSHMPKFQSEQRRGGKRQRKGDKLACNSQNIGVKGQPLSMAGDVIVFDEGHNVADTARSCQRIEISYTSLRRFHNMFAVYLEYYQYILLFENKQKLRSILTAVKNLQKYLKMIHNAEEARVVRKKMMEEATKLYMGRKNPLSPHFSGVDVGSFLSASDRIEVSRIAEQLARERGLCSLHNDDIEELNSEYSCGGKQRFTAGRNGNKIVIGHTLKFDSFLFAADIHNIDFSDLIRFIILKDLPRLLRYFCESYLRKKYDIKKNDIINQQAKLQNGVDVASSCNSRSEIHNNFTTVGFGSPFFGKSHKTAQMPRFKSKVTSLNNYTQKEHLRQPVLEQELEFSDDDVSDRTSTLYSHSSDLSATSSDETKSFLTEVNVFNPSRMSLQEWSSKEAVLNTKAMYEVIDLFDRLATVESEEKRRGGGLIDKEGNTFVPACHILITREEEITDPLKDSSRTGVNLTGGTNESRTSTVKPNKFYSERLGLLVISSDISEVMNQLQIECRNIFLAGGTMQPLSLTCDPLFQDSIPQTTFPLPLSPITEGFNSTKNYIFQAFNHIVDVKENLRVFPITKGPSRSKEAGDVEFRFTHAQLQRTELLSATLEQSVEAVLAMARVIPHGLVLFFPSYTRQDEFWDFFSSYKGGSVLRQLEYLKKVFIELRGLMAQKTGKTADLVLKAFTDYVENRHSTLDIVEGDATNAFLDETLNDDAKLERSGLFSVDESQGGKVKASITTIPSRGSQSSTHFRGAILSCVMSGRISEGINLNDHLGRGVMVFGIPYTSTGDAETTIQLKDIAMKQSIDELKERRRGCIIQGDEYQLQPRLEELNRRTFQLRVAVAMRAVNQAIGRCIRRFDDYAVILLCDARFGETETATSGNYRSGNCLPANHIPKWMLEGKSDVGVIKKGVIKSHSDVSPGFGAVEDNIRRFFSGRNK